RLEAHKEGFTLVEAKKPRQLETGGWQPCEIVLASEGTLRIHVHDATGAPVSGVRAEVGVASTERHGAPRGSPEVSTSRFNATPATDAAGTATLCVCAEQCLRVRMMWPDDDVGCFTSVFERVEGERLVSEDVERGSQLFVASGGARDVRVELAAH